MEVSSDESACDVPLSAESRHGLALVKLQGFTPDAAFLQLLAELDAGTCTTEEAIERILAPHRRS